MSMTEQSSVYALLVNGSTVEIGPARPGDYDAVKAMHQAMSPRRPAGPGPAAPVTGPFPPCHEPRRAIRGK